MKYKGAPLTLCIMRPLIGLLFFLLFQSAAMAQISHGPSSFQKKDEKIAAQQKKEIETVFQDTHLERGYNKKKNETGRQKIIRTEKRKLRFNNRGKAVKRRHLKNGESLNLVEKIF